MPRDGSGRAACHRRGRGRARRPARVDAGTAVRILTGAPVPPGADAVVPVEDTDAAAGRRRSARTRRHPRVRSRPARTSAARQRPARRAATAGCRETLLTPAAIAIAAAGGHGTLSVHRRPRVAVLATGDELVPAGDAARRRPRSPTATRPGLTGRRRAMPARRFARWASRATPSNRSATPSHQGLEWADVIVASGGVSVGAHDVVQGCVRGARPDRPVARRRPAGQAARLRRAPSAQGSRDVLLFGLPGNPVSSFVTFELFVRPVLRRLAGHADVIGREIVGDARGPVRKAPGRRAFVRVALTRVGDGWQAALAGGQESHVLSALAAADGLAIIPETMDEAAGGHRGGRDPHQMTDPTSRTRDRSARERRRLTHVNRGGRPRMVDVSAKPATARRAIAEAFVTLEQETLSAIIDGQMTKGDVLTVAEMAGVMGAKKTSDLIPLCHPIPLTDLVVEITPERNAGGVRIRATAATVGRTGVEMEALTAAAVAALTVYDMVKGVDRSAAIRDVRLLEKSGGKSGEWHRRRRTSPAQHRKPARQRADRTRHALDAKRGQRLDRRSARSC